MSVKRLFYAHRVSLIAAFRVNRSEVLKNLCEVLLNIDYPIKFAGKFHTNSSKLKMYPCKIPAVILETSKMQTMLCTP